jgi:flagellar FliJ protein
MRRFRFRLDPVIKYRQYRERIALMNVARAKQALIETTNRIRQIGNSRKAAQRELDSAQAEGIGVDRYRRYATYLDRLHREMESENERLIEAGKTIKEKQQIAEGETIRKDTFEWLKQREYEEYQQIVSRAEQKAADELVGLTRKPNKGKTV